MGKPAFVRILAVFFAIGGLWTASTQRAPEPLQISNVNGPLHVISGSGGNVAVLATSAGAILVDDKFERNVAEILEKVATVTDQPVRYVLNTHHHGDHSGGNEKLGVSAQLIAHENARANLVRNNQAGAQHVTFSEEASVHLGGERVRLFYFGLGHTSGDAIIYFPRQRTIHTGDLFVRGAPFIDYANGGSAIEWDDTLNAILQLEFSTVIPGHGAVATREDLTDWKENFETYRNRISDLAGDGKTPEQVAEQLRLDDIEGWSVGRLQLRSFEGLLQELR